LQPDASALSAALRNAGIDAPVADERLGLVARPAIADTPAALRALHAADYEMLVDLFGIDTGEDIEITYHIRSFTRDEDAYLKVNLPYDAMLTSVWDVYPAALYPEREAAEMFGLRLVGHPNPKRLLTSDEFDAPILRKSVPIRTDIELERPGISREHLKAAEEANGNG